MKWLQIIAVSLCAGMAGCAADDIDREQAHRFAEYQAERMLQRPLTEEEKQAVVIESKNGQVQTTYKEPLASRLFGLSQGKKESARPATQP